MDKKSIIEEIIMLLSSATEEQIRELKVFIKTYLS